MEKSQNENKMSKFIANMWLVIISGCLGALLIAITTKIISWMF